MATTSNQRNTVVLLASAGLTGVLSAVYLHLVGVGEESMGVVLRLSAQTALVVLLAVFIARPLRQLVVMPTTAALSRNRRLLGITFAGVHTAHLGLLVYWANQSPDFELNLTVNHLGALTYLVIFLMLITSYDRPARAIGPGNWKILHKAGLYWVFASFLQTQLPRSLDQLAEANWWFITMITIAIVIRLTAFFARRR